MDPIKLDSLKRSIERDRNSIRKEQIEILKMQDSLLQASTKKINEKTKEKGAANDEKEGELPLLIPLVSAGAAVLLFLLAKRKKSTFLPRE